MLKYIFCFIFIFIARPVIVYSADINGHHPTLEKAPDFSASPVMIFVKGGCFDMGDTFGEGEVDEQPVHEVCVNDFHMGKYEVTQKEWKAVMGSNPSMFKWCDRCPVQRVTWDEVQEYIKKLSKNTGKHYRLPTEAEWEYAAREGGKRVRFATGKDTIGAEEANFNASNGEESYSRVGVDRSKMLTVGSFAANSLGLYDMSGNVWEWVGDWYDRHYYSTSPRNNPKGPSGGSDRVIRGGSWAYGPKDIRAAKRENFGHHRQHQSIGFRLVVGSSTGRFIASSADIKVHPPTLEKVPDFFVSPVMVFVKGGCFDMGDTFGEGEVDEQPVHEVCVDDFHMGKYEVTQKEWKAVMGSNPSHFKSCGGRCPVERVRWGDVQDYIKKLNRNTGKHYRLPTEAEWEYAAREGGKRVRFGTGKDTIGVEEANFDARHAWKESYSRVGVYRERTMPVGSFAPNSLGLYDMSGNVWEWVGDRYGKNYYKKSPRSNPHGPSRRSARLRVIRGGSWAGAPRFLRAADHYYGAPYSRYGSIGFRLVVGSSPGR